MTHQEKLAWQRRHRRLTNNADIHKYEKTVPGFLMRLYRNMKSRVTGIQRMKAHLYVGKYLLPKEEFYAWAMRSARFRELFVSWKESGYDRKLTPTVDRIDSALGYSLANMEWVTHSENSRRGALSRIKLAA